MRFSAIQSYPSGLGRRPQLPPVAYSDPLDFEQIPARAWELRQMKQRFPFRQLQERPVELFHLAVESVPSLAVPDRFDPGTAVRDNRAQVAPDMPDRAQVVPDMPDRAQVAPDMPDRDRIAQALADLEMAPVDPGQTDQDTVGQVRFLASDIQAYRRDTASEVPSGESGKLQPDLPFAFVCLLQGPNRLFF